MQLNIVAYPCSGFSNARKCVNLLQGSKHRTNIDIVHIDDERFPGATFVFFMIGGKIYVKKFLIDSEVRIHSSIDIFFERGESAFDLSVAMMIEIECEDKDHGKFLCFVAQKSREIVS